MRPRLGLPGLVGRKTGSLSRLGGPSGTLLGKVEVVLRLPDGRGVFGVDELSNVGDTLFLHRHSRQALAREAGDLLEPSRMTPESSFSVQPVTATSDLQVSSLR